MKQKIMQIKMGYGKGIIFITTSQKKMVVEYFKKTFLNVYTLLNYQVILIICID